MEVIRVPQDDLGARLLQILEEDSFHGALRPDGHESGRVNNTMRRVELAEAGTSIGTQERKRKGVESHDPIYYGSQT